jgi:hypothetical protein
LPVEQGIPVDYNEACTHAHIRKTAISHGKKIGRNVMRGIRMQVSV